MTWFIQFKQIAGAFPWPHHLGEEDTKDVMAVPWDLQKLQDQRGRDVVQTKGLNSSVRVAEYFSTSMIQWWILCSLQHVGSQNGSGWRLVKYSNAPDRHNPKKSSITQTSVQRVFEIAAPIPAPSPTNSQRINKYPSPCSSLISLILLAGHCVKHDLMTRLV